LLVTLVMGAVNACSNQGEGERCDPASGNNDCESGLICRTLTPTTTTAVQEDGGGEVMAAPTYTAAVCCPDPMIPGVVATSAACQSIGNTAGNRIPKEDAGTGGAGGAGGASGAAGAAGAAGASGAAGNESGGAGGTAGASGAAGSESGGESGVAGSAGSGRDGGPDAASEAGM
jgi:hypothetical protein